MTPVYLILDPSQRGDIYNEFWVDVKTFHRVEIVYTDTLDHTAYHKAFRNQFKGDKVFRKGYWQHVKERFFYVEELMRRNSLVDVVSMEYDVMVYGSFKGILEKLKNSPNPNTLRIVMDNNTRGHPAFMYIPDASKIEHFNGFLVSIVDHPFEDMQSLAMYSEYFPERIHFFPCITEARNQSICPRRSAVGHVHDTPIFLSEDSEHFGVLFDSLSVGQYVGGIDSRNTQGHKVANYINETALYSVKEMPFTWKKSPENFLWQPILDGRPLMTIHVHSKALSCFASDRPDYPKDDYKVDEVFKTLLPN
jgi:hypothetical protein